MKTISVLFMLITVSFFANAQVSVDVFSTEQKSPSSMQIGLTLSNTDCPDTLTWTFTPQGQIIPSAFGQEFINSNEVQFTATGLQPGTYDVRLTFNGTQDVWRQATIVQTSTGVVNVSDASAAITLTGRTLLVTTTNEYMGKLITVYNIIGQPMMTVTINSSVEKIELPFAAGAYIVSVTGEKRTTKKLNIN